MRSPLRLVVLAVAAATSAACHSSSSDLGPVPTECNGHAELCDRPYDRVAFPGTHDSYSDLAENFIASDQSYPIARQLSDGIRVLHFEMHWWDAELGDGPLVYLCHSACQIGASKLSDALTTIHSFADANPAEVITLLTEANDAAVSDIAATVQASGLVPSLHIQAAGAPWPTLSTLVRGHDHVVMFLDQPADATYPWLLPRWVWTWETPWDNETPTDFGRCKLDRGTQGVGTLYTVDTYLEDQAVPTAVHAALVNDDPFLVERLLDCQNTSGILPTFVMVNYYEVGDLFHVVDVLNGFVTTSQVDLTTFPPTSWPGSTPDAGVTDVGVEVGVPNDAGESDAETDVGLGDVSDSGA